MLVALFTEGLPLYLAAMVTVGTLLLYVFQGLAVVHAVFNWRRWPRAALFVFSLLLLVFAWPLVLPLLAFGRVEDITRERDRLV